MEKSWIIIAVILIGAFSSVESLRCYSCVNCAASSLTDDHLVTCGAIPTQTSANADPALQKTSRNNLVEWRCLITVSQGITTRSCGFEQTCVAHNALPTVTCTSCNTDACNGAFKMQHSMAAMLLLLVAVFVANKN